VKKLIAIMVTEGCSPETRALFDEASNIPDFDHAGRVRMVERFQEIWERNVAGFQADAYISIEEQFVPEAVIEQGGSDVLDLLFDGLCFRLIEQCMSRVDVEDGGAGFFTAVVET
jgi:hypothetical protein